MIYIIKFINIKIKMSRANLNGSDDFLGYQNDRSVQIGHFDSQDTGYFVVC